MSDNSRKDDGPLAEVIRDLTPIDPTEALQRLKVLVETEPDLTVVDDDYAFPAESLEWLGQLDAVVSAMKRGSDEMTLRAATSGLLRTQGRRGESEIRAVLYRALAAAELAAPASERGSFIAAGNQLDAYAAISKVLASAHHDLIVVDPYMDGKALSDFLPSAAEGVMLGVLVDEALAKPSLAPAAEKWSTQFGSDRPLQVRLARARSLHDRLIVVDGREVWSLTQSLKDFANRAHGAVLKVDAETARLKIAAYQEIWQDARRL